MRLRLMCMLKITLKGGNREQFYRHPHEYAVLVGIQRCKVHRELLPERVAHHLAMWNCSYYKHLDNPDFNNRRDQHRELDGDDAGHGLCELANN